MKQKRKIHLAITAICYDKSVLLLKFKETEAERGFMALSCLQNADSLTRNLRQAFFSRHGPLTHTAKFLLHVSPYVPIRNSESERLHLSLKFRPCEFLSERLEREMKGNVLT